MFSRFPIKKFRVFLFTPEKHLLNFETWEWNKQSPRHEYIFLGTKKKLSLNFLIKEKKKLGTLNYKIAVIIPFRNRLPQLKTLLYYLHMILQTQLLDYRIFVVEPTSPPEVRFNKGRVMNSVILIWNDD